MLISMLGRVRIATILLVVYNMEGKHYICVNLQENILVCAILYAAFHFLLTNEYPESLP